MRKLKYFKCPECGMKFTALNGWAKHIKRDHPGLKPKEMTDMQYLYYTITGKTHGNCIQCHGETSWNETNGKYNRFCNNPNCKVEYTKMAKQRMVDKYGKQHLLNDPDMQRKMLKGKHISGTYKFSNNSGSVDYVGTYEKDFLYIMDHVMGFSAGDIMGPSPHNYIYSYEGKARVYIPDFYIPNYNLEIEIKTDENMHHKIQAVDKVKEHLKDEMMSHNPSVNYFKVLDKKYDDFFKYLLDKKFDIDDMAMENVNKYLSGTTENAIPEITEVEPVNEGALDKLKTAMINKKYPGTDARINSCIGAISSSIRSHANRCIENSPYFKASKNRKIESSNFDRNTLKINKTPNGIVVKSGMFLLHTSFSPAYDINDKSFRYSFDKDKSEFKNAILNAIKGFLSNKSEIEKKYNCNISVNLSDVSFENGSDNNGNHATDYIRKWAEISFQISFNV